MHEIKDFLIKLGLSPKETDVYLTGLKNGPMHASDIAKECGLTRPNVYDVLKRLQKRGLMHQLGSLYGRKFKMASPQELQTLIIRKGKEHKELEKEISTILPFITGIQGKFYEPYPKIEFFEGVEGIKTLMEKSLLTEKKIIKTATSLKSWVELFGEEFTNLYIEGRVERGIKSLTLRSRSGELNEPFYQQHKKQMREVRYLPENIKMDSTIMLFDDKIVLIAQKKENLGILLQSKSYSQTFESWFDFIWKFGKSV